jgi:hypothetical protein
VSGERTWWQCACGARIKVPADKKRRRVRVCPHCGAKLGSEQTVIPEVSAGDTQMVNIAEMARMAQEGIEVAASGEWDTSSAPGPAKRCRKK